jgi:UDP-N-acetyl-D-mannosaminuronic acid dehydrogenase
MPKKETDYLTSWKVQKIAVVGPGIVGMPMAALLAHAKIRIGSNNPATVVVIQRQSPTSAWKVATINAGKSVIGGIEPDLDRIVSESVADRVLSASHDYSQVSDADVILICVQTDKKGMGPDYGPLMECLESIAAALLKRPAASRPLIIFESTLAPSSMATVIKDHFARFGLIDGRDILLGNSPNRVMPGRLVERVRGSDKVVGGLCAEAVQKIKLLYSHIVTAGALHVTNSFSAEIIKTLENAYRDARIAFSTEIVRYCDEHDIDFYAVRDAVNARCGQSDSASKDPNAVPSGGLLVPTIGVGGHCLPKDGILLLWRQIESGADMSNSLILQSRKINDESPAETIRCAERRFGSLNGATVTLLGAAYRFNSEDTRNSPTLPLARLLLDKGCAVSIHDPYVKPDDQNIRKFDLRGNFSNDLTKSLVSADYIIFCTAHRIYAEKAAQIIAASDRLKGVFDGCNLFPGNGAFGKDGPAMTGIGRGAVRPPAGFVDFVYESFRVVERGVANEVKRYIDFANRAYVRDDFNTISFETVKRIAGTCVTGCAITDYGTIGKAPRYQDFVSRLATCAEKAGGLP